MAIFRLCNGKQTCIARACFLALAMVFLLTAPIAAQADDPSPPAAPVKLIFIHHSCGENWLADGQGGLGVALGQQLLRQRHQLWLGAGRHRRHAPTSPTGPSGSPAADSDRYLRRPLSPRAGSTRDYTRPLADPGRREPDRHVQVLLPQLEPGGPARTTRPRRGDGLTVANAKAIYNELLAYFATRPDKLFIVVTAPPVQDPAFAANARAFNRWLVHDWLAGYRGTTWRSSTSTTC